MVHGKRGGGKIGAKHNKVASVAKTPGHSYAGARDVADAPPTTSAGDAESSGQVCWAFHPCQRDDANKHQPLSSAVVRANTQDHLMEGRGSYREGFERVTRMNPEVAGVVRRHTVMLATRGGTNGRAPCSAITATRTPPIRRRRQQWQALMRPRNLGERFETRCDGHRTMRVLASSSCA